MPTNPPELRVLVAALANEPTRPIEAHLTANFKYLPPPSATRGSLRREVSPDVRIAAAKIEKLALELDTPEHSALVGVAYLVTGAFDKAVVALEHAAAERPSVGPFLSDLSAAYLARARDANSAEDYAKALSASERALKAGASFREARFNRALALERLHLTEQARAAWQEIANADESPWRDEAAAHLTRIAAIGPSPDHLRLSILDAANRADWMAVDTHATAAADMVRAVVIDTVLPNWAESWLAGDIATAEVELAKARRLTAALQHFASEHFLTETLGDIDARGHRGRAAYARAEQSYARAEVLFAEFQFDEALPLYQAVYRTLGSESPLAIAALVREGTVDYQTHRYAESGPKLSRAIRLAAARGYDELKGRAETVVGLLAVNQGQFAQGLAALAQSADSFTKAGDIDGLVNARISAGQTFDIIGQQSRGWRYYRDGLEYLDRLRTAKRKQGLLDALALACADQGLVEAALHFNEEYVSITESTGVAAVAAEAQARRAALLARIGDLPGAQRAIERARSWNRRTAVASAAFNDARIDTVAAQLLERIDPKQSAQRLGEVIDYYRRSGRRADLPEAFLVSGKAWLAVGDPVRAERNFRDGLDILHELQRSLSSRDFQAAYVDTTFGLVDAMVQLFVELGTPELAFKIIDDERNRGLRSRNSSADVRDLSLTPSAMSERLPAGITVLVYHVLADRILCWSIRSREAAFVETRIDAGRLAKDVRRFRSQIHERLDSRRVGLELYDVLVRPARNALRAGDVLIVVPDAPLYDLPFGALPLGDSDEFLVESHPWAVVSSASVLLDRLAGAEGMGLGGAPDDALIVGVTDTVDITGARVAPLPAVREEVAEIGRLYAHASTLLDRAATKRAFLDQFGRHTIVHFGGHAILNRDSPALSHLLLAAEPEGSAGPVFPADIASAKAGKTRMVVLASCDSAEGFQSRSQGIFNLATPFIEAGVATVVATLWAVSDQPSSAIFAALHRSLAVGGTPLEAVQSSQVDAILSSHRDQRVIADWAAIEVVLGR